MDCEAALNTTPKPMDPFKGWENIEFTIWWPEKWKFHFDYYWNNGTGD